MSQRRSPVSQPRPGTGFTEAFATRRGANEVQCDVNVRQLVEGHRVE